MHNPHLLIRQGHASERRQRAARRERASALRLAMARHVAATPTHDTPTEAPAGLLQRVHCLLRTPPVE